MRAGGPVGLIQGVLKHSRRVFAHMLEQLQVNVFGFEVEAAHHVAQVDGYPVNEGQARAQVPENVANG